MKLQSLVVPGYLIMTVLTATLVNHFVIDRDVFTSTLIGLVWPITLPYFILVGIVKLTTMGLQLIL